MIDFLKKSPYLFLTIVFVVTRLIYAYVGVEFDYSWVYKQWHLIDFDLMQSQLIKSLWYFHYQPPLFNFFVGLLAKLPSNFNAHVTHLTYVSMTLFSSWLIYSILTIFGLLIFLAGLWKDLSKKYHFKKSIFKFDKKDDNKKNLIVSYSAHSVELFGMWAWLPVFLSIILLDIAELSPVVIGLLVGVVLHFSGFIANMIAGTLSDRLGRRFITVLFALSSGSISFLIGWIVDWNWMIILIISILYSFFCIGDSSVLTASLTENTSRSVLGRALAFRSIIGIGLASITPAIFGYILDLSNNHQPIDTSTNWVYAFSFLGISG